MPKRELATTTQKDATDARKRAAKAAAAPAADSDAPPASA